MHRVSRAWIFISLLVFGLVGCDSLSVNSDTAAEASRALSYNSGDLPEPTLLVNGVIFTQDSELTILDPGWIFLEGRLISEMGRGAPPEKPGIRTIDLEGRHVTPGLIDTHSHLGVYPAPSLRAHSDGNEATAPLTAGVSAIAGIWPQDPGFQRALAGGVTTLLILPGSANLVGGRAVVVKPVPALSGQQMKFPKAKDALKMACGENPKRVYGGRQQMPSSRMGNMGVLRQAFADAASYRDSWERYERQRTRVSVDELDVPERDIALETLVAALNDELTVQIHCYRSDDMVQMMALQDEFGLPIRSFHHAVEAYKVRDLLASREISASVWSDWWGFKVEAWDTMMENAALIHTAGARAVIHSDSAEGIQRLNQETSKALQAGRERGMEISDAEALSWITTNAAWTLGIEDRVGSLGQGRSADLVVWSDHPLSVYARADYVFIDGHLLWDRAQEDAFLWSDFDRGTYSAHVEGFGDTTLDPKDEPLPQVAPEAEPEEAAADDEPEELAGRMTEFEADRISLGDGTTVVNGSVLVQEGQVAEVLGERLQSWEDSLADFPEGGTWITPGFIDITTQLGLLDIGLEKSTRDDALAGDEPLRGDFHARDGLRLTSTLLPIALDGGITTTLTLPNRGLVSGLAAWLVIHGYHPERVGYGYSTGAFGAEAQSRRSVATNAATLPEFGALVFDMTRAGANAAGESRAAVWTKIRELERKAEEESEADDKIDPLTERFREVLAGDLPLVIHVHRAEDMLALLNWRADRPIRMIFLEATQAWMIARRLAEAKIPVVVHGLSNLPRSFDHDGARLDAAKILHDAGVTVMFGRFDTHLVRTLRFSVANAVRAGLPHHVAVAAITGRPAQAAGVGDQIGMLKPGLQANFLLWDGDPLEISSSIQQAVVDGRDAVLENRQDALYEAYAEDSNLRWPSGVQAGAQRLVAE